MQTKLNQLCRMWTQTKWWVCSQNKVLHLVWVMARQLELWTTFSNRLVDPQNTIQPSSLAAGPHCHMIGCFCACHWVFVIITVSLLAIAHCTEFKVDFSFAPCRADYVAENFIAPSNLDKSGADQIHSYILTFQNKSTWDFIFSMLVLCICHALRV